MAVQVVFYASTHLNNNNNNNNINNQLCSRVCQDIDYIRDP